MPPPTSAANTTKSTAFKVRFFGGSWKTASPRGRTVRELPHLHGSAAAPAAHHVVVNQRRRINLKRMRIPANESTHIDGFGQILKALLSSARESVSRQDGTVRPYRPQKCLRPLEQLEAPHQTPLGAADASSRTGIVGSACVWAVSPCSVLRLGSSFSDAEPLERSAAFFCSGVVKLLSAMDAPQ